jgi:hypothetical protein
MTTRTSRIARWVVAGLAVGVLMASCGDDDEPSSTPSSTTSVTTTTVAASDPAPSGDVCADRDALRSSVEDLKATDVQAEGAAGLTAAITSLKGDLVALQGSVDAELEPQVQDVQGAVDELETAVADIDSDGASQALSAVADVASSAATLLDLLEAAQC